jgi:MoaA/NifB/PqqE/SkfB family radical SAM enzyme
VVPAQNGCNLKCGFCIVRQRQETTETLLKPEDYARFIREAAEHKRPYAVSIQGYEPLLPEALPYTQAILATARFLGIPAGLVTNGVGLADAVELLQTLAPTKIAVSIDAASADLHDRIRGVAGAWQASVAGVRKAAATLASHTRMAVTSVLLPSRRHHLDAMPALLRDIGIDQWILSPLLRVGRDGAGGPVGDRARLFRDVAILQEAADRAGVRMVVDDELGLLDCTAVSPFQPGMRSVDIRTLPARVELYRLTPGGQCSKGSDALREVTPATPRWRPGETNAAAFLATFA